MPINPSGGNCQDQHQGRGCSGLPPEREAKPERQPAPSLWAFFSSRRLFGEGAPDAWPKRRGLGVIAQFLRCNAKGFPATNFFGAGDAARAVRFEGSPLGGRAVLKNPVSIFTSDVHRCLP